MGDVHPHLWSDKGCQCSGRETLKLTELRGYEGRRGDKGVRENLGHDRLGAFLVRRVKVGEKKADRDGFHAGVAKGARRIAHALFIQRLEFLPVRRGETSGN